MKVGKITTANQKGQIVIPKEIRDRLHITSDIPLHITLRDQGVYIYPLSKPTMQTEKNKALLKLLKMTQGILAGEEWDPLEKERRKIELTATRRNKKAW